MGELLYKHEHLSCYNYQKERPLIEGLEVPEGGTWEGQLLENKIFFVMEGRFSITGGNIANKAVCKGQMFLITQGCSYNIYAERNTSIIIIRLRGYINLCNRFSIEQLYKDRIEPDEVFNPLPINEQILGYLHYTFSYVMDGLKCLHFFEMKLQELFFLLRAYYTKENLMLFFYPLLNNNQAFSDFVYKNYLKVKTVYELADLAHMSLSNFKKRFRKSFGKPPHQWMKEQKSIRIFYDINDSDIPLKYIVSKYNFSSLSQFNDFCKLQFGKPPGQLRKKCLINLLNEPSENKDEI